MHKLFPGWPDKRVSQLRLCVMLCAILLSAVGVQAYFLGEDDKHEQAAENICV